MKIVVAMSGFPAGVMADEATAAAAQGFRQGYREASVVERPLILECGSVLDDSHYSSLVVARSGLLAELDNADLVITGEGEVDMRTAKSRVSFAVARAAAERGVAAIVIGGLGEDVAGGHPPEFSALFSPFLWPMPRLAHDTAGSSQARGADATREALRFCAEQIARLARVFALSYPVATDEGAGGIVIRRADDRYEVLMIFDRYGFVSPPKGHFEPGETPEDAATREVFEETGIRTRVLADIGSLRYRFFGGAGPVQKTVRFYLMEAIGGQLKPQAGETLDVRWVPVDDLASYKTYRDTHLLVRRALEAHKGPTMA